MKKCCIVIRLRAEIKTRKRNPKRVERRMRRKQHRKGKQDFRKRREHNAYTEKLEIEILKELDHPSIARVIDIYEDKKKFYFV